MALAANLIVLFSLFLGVYSAPFDAVQNGTSSEAPVLVTQIITSNVEVIETSTVILQTSQDASTPSTTSSLATAAPPPSQAESSIPPPPQPITNIVTVISTSTTPPIMVTVSVPPTTVTQTIITTPSPSSSAGPASASSGSPTAWTVPPLITDLTSFKISYFPYGQDNLAIVNGSQSQGQPNASTATDLAAVAAAGISRPSSVPTQSPSTVNGTNAALQLFYPAGSINPESQPQGGADFYASPIDISKAKNVTLEYSVFFPADFDWVLAGKLPGLYGGHSGCSGGNDARSCFSTRLMWRAEGAGELYLYAPKDKQTKALCSAPPQSVCDQEYGLSISRGSFNFASGAWTHVKQTVTLNTPGGQDGGFVLDVNGQEVMRRADVFYRDAAVASEPPNGDGGDGDGLDEDEPDDGSGDDDDDDGEDDDNDPAPEQPPPQPTAKPAPLLDPGAVPILGPLLNGLRFRVMGSPHYVDVASGENMSHFLTLQSRDDSVPLWLSGVNSSAFILPPEAQNNSSISASPAMLATTTTQLVAAEGVTQTMSVQATVTAVVYIDQSQTSTPSGSFVAEAQSTPAQVGFSL